MSIWCSWPAVGQEPFDPAEPNRGGDVRTYAEGWSNHFPTTDGTAELPACIDLADIAPWCVPGHGQELIDGAWTCPGCGADHDHPETGPWLRLGVTSMASRHWWTQDGKPGPHDGPGLDTFVVMDEGAARQLRDDLTEWLERPKVQPT